MNYVHFIGYNYASRGNAPVFTVAYLWILYSPEYNEEAELISDLDLKDFSCQHTYCTENTIRHTTKPNFLNEPCRFRSSYSKRFIATGIVIFNCSALVS